MYYRSFKISAFILILGAATFAGSNNSNARDITSAQIARYNACMAPHKAKSRARGDYSIWRSGREKCSHHLGR